MAAMGAADGSLDLDIADNKSQTQPDRSTSEHDQSHDDNDDGAGNDSGAENDSDTKPSAPLQKRRRVTRACDECRRKKIKCDGKQPCTHCTVYSYECTYDQPSNRRRNPAPQVLEALEQRLQKAESILRSVLPGIDIHDPKYDARTIEQIIESAKNTPRGRHTAHQDQADDDAQMRSMVGRTGSLDLDDSGYYDYHGHSSGYMFMRKFRSQFGDDFLPNPRPIENRNLANVQESPRSLYSSPLEAGLLVSTDLPPKDVAVELCRNAIDDCCALQRPLHKPTFFKRLDSIYNTDPEHYTNEHVKFLPLLYIVMGVGCLFGRFEGPEVELDKKGYKFATEQGYQYFNVGKSMLDITDCRDLVSIQAVMFMILFLQGTAKLATCYAYVGVALRACCRLGMHRKITANFNTIEQEERKRIFWQVRKMDIYVGAMLGLPQMLSNDDIDQDNPSEAPDECITEAGITPPPPGKFSLHAATNAHSRLLKILQKVVKYVYPIKPVESSTANATGDYTISHSRVRELERDLEQWINELPMQLRPSDNNDVELSRVQQLLRMSYAYVQMMIYRPFLHYVAQACQTGLTDKRKFGCAAACVTVAQNIVHITTDMKKRGLLNGAYWFVMYTTYFAILSLLYFVLENPESDTSKNILKDAIEGRDTLANLATRSLAADRCTSSLTGLFDALPDKLNERRTSLKVQPNISRKRPSSNNDPLFFGPQSTGKGFQPPVPVSEYPTIPHLRVATMPQEYLARNKKRMSMPDSHSANASPHPFRTPESSHFPTSGTTPSDNNSGFASHLATPTLDFGTPALVNGHLPDLKSVMFPGDNPFAYPNQPMSTLDTMQNAPFGNDPMSAIDQYGNASMDMDMNQQQFAGGKPQSQFPNSFHAPQFFNMDNLSSEPMQMHTNPQQPQHSQPQQQQPQPGAGGLRVPPGGQGPNQDEEDYWSHAPARGHFRTGLTPGGQGVNLDLDDIFGNNQGWNMPLNMGLPDSVGGQQNSNQMPFFQGHQPMWQ